MSCGTTNTPGSCKALTDRFVDVKEERNLNRVCNTQFSKPIFMLFYSSANQDSVDLKDILKEYFETTEVECVFAFVDVTLDGTKGLVKDFHVDKVPQALLIDSTRTILKKYEEVDPVTIYESLEAQVTQFREAYEKQKEEIYPYIDKLVQQKPIMIFIKGTVKDPECGFTEQLIEVLNKAGVEFEHFNIFSEQGKIRNWIKEYSKWPSIPQVFVHGKIVGGLDKTKELLASGELEKLVPEAFKSNIKKNTGLQEVLSQYPAVLFVTSDFEHSEETAELCHNASQSLQMKGLRVKVQDVAGNPSLEKEVTALAGGKSLPLLFKNLQLVLAGTELTEKLKTSDLKEYFDETSYRSDVFKEIEGLIKSHPVFVFIKGTPDNPQCGFTNTLLGILAKHKVDFKSFNILEDQLIREKLKQYSNWKTYPQIYIDGELVGGLDIVKQLIEDGEFESMVKHSLKKD